jgi:hypothetical protein
MRKHVNGTGGDGCLAGSSSKNPREGENQEGSWLLTTPQNSVSEVRLLKGIKALEEVHSGAHEAS